MSRLVDSARPHRYPMFVGILMLLVITTVLTAVVARMPPEGRAPFEAVRWNNSSLEARLDGNWYRVTSLNEEPIDELVKFAKTVVPGTWRDRIPWDLEHVLDLYDSPLNGDAIAVEVVDPVDASRRRVINATLREETYKASDWAKKRGGWGRKLRIESADLSSSQVKEDINFLLERIEDQFSYRVLTGYDYETAFSEMIASADGDIRHRDFAKQLRMLMAPFGDGHSRVSAPLNNVLPPGAIPCVFRPGEGGRVIAHNPDHSSFLAPEFPYVLSIDGIAVSECMEAVRPLVIHGSPQFERMQELRLLQFISWWRGLLGVQDAEQVKLTLGHMHNRETREVVVVRSSSAPIPVMWPRTTSHVRNDNIGYLRLESMDRGSGYQSWLGRRMHAFEDTAGLIIDVRGNGGGSRDALQVVAPFLLSPDQPAQVANVACYRLSEEIEGDGVDVLENRSLYLTDDSRWSEAELGAIDQTMASFEPDWPLPLDEFSAWHVMMVGRDQIDDVYYYNKPVVVLMDDRCFSATDIFVGGLKGIKNVTLLGTATSGGSGRSKRVTLPHSGIRVSLSSIASFQRDGSRYDGRGVAPDVELMAEPTFWLVDGEDNMLNEAISRILAESD